MGGGDPSEAERRAERRIGSTVGKYRLERVLGLGGMACVYQAIHRNGHKVAIKMLHPEVSADADLRARFVREGYAANAIDHRGVVRVLDDDETEDGSAFLVMELLDGETLASRCKRAGGKLPVREALALGHQLLDVVAAAHAKGVVHRDIKPENLFVTGAGELKVLDFGIARVRLASSDSEPTHTGRAMGTPAFMAPEQAFGRAREVDERTDVFSCGATLFSVLSGRLVHEAESAQEQMVYAATRPARSLASVDPGGAELPRPVVALVDRALAFERADRWQTAVAMRDAIAGASVELFGEKLSPAPTSPPSARAARATLESAPTMDARATPRAPPEHNAPASTPAVLTLPRSRASRWLGAGAAVVAVAVAAAWLSARRDAPAPASTPSVTSAQPTCTAAACAAGGRRRSVATARACRSSRPTAPSSRARRTWVATTRCGSAPCSRRGARWRSTSSSPSAPSSWPAATSSRWPTASPERGRAPRRGPSASCCATTAWIRSASRGTWPTTWAFRRSSGSPAARRWSTWRCRSSTRAGSSCSPPTRRRC